MNLMSKIGDTVFLTSLTKKITINGKTEIYPVYQILIDELYYNDQNDRIASWMAGYRAANGRNSLEDLPKNEYNKVIEKFIIESNPESINRTEKNIFMIGQREPGVVLNDGRVIDGNRRFTCIRRIRENHKDFKYFEAVIIDEDFAESKKAIKMLELGIQHGEEKRVDYNQIEKLIGIYNDVVETELLTVEEYASIVNEKPIEIRKKVNGAKVLVEFSEYIGFAKQFNIVREYQIVSSINDYLEIEKTIRNEEVAKKIKNIYFLYVVLNSLRAGRDFFKSMKTIVENGDLGEFYEEIKLIEKNFFESKNKYNPKTYKQLIEVVKANLSLTEESKNILDSYLDDARKSELFKKPTQIVTKTITSIKSIDVNILNKMTNFQKERFKSNLQSLKDDILQMESIVETKKPEEKEEVKAPLFNETDKKIDNIKSNIDNKSAVSKSNDGYKIKASSYDDFIEFVDYNGSKICSFHVSLLLRKKNSEVPSIYKLFFINKNNKIVSDKSVATLDSTPKEVIFNLTEDIKEENSIYLAIQDTSNSENELNYLLEFEVEILFESFF